MAARPFDEPASDYASRNVFWIAPETRLHVVAQDLLERGISAALVRGPDRRVLGMVSSSDILEAVELDIERPDQPTARPTDKTAAQIMRTELVCVDEGTPVREAAIRMAERRIHRVWVTRRAEHVGVLTAHDLMRAVLEHHVEAPLSSIMSTPVHTIGLGATVREAAQRLASVGTHGLVVVDGEAPIGVFTQTEAIATRWLPPELLGSSVEHVMSYEMIALAPDTPLRRVAGHACVLHARRVLAVEERKLRGIATGLDFARYVATH